MHIKPTNDLLVIREISQKTVKTDWGFELPATADNIDTPYTGEVLFTGPGKHAKLSQAAEDVVESLRSLIDQFHRMPNVDWPSRGISLQHWAAAEKALKSHDETAQRIPMQVKQGDEVIFSKNGRQFFKINGEMVTVCGEASIMAVIG
jgi:co-chaperonin GroES (HSP10)